MFEPNYKLSVLLADGQYLEFSGSAQEMYNKQHEYLLAGGFSRIIMNSPPLEDDESCLDGYTEGDNWGMD